MAIVGIDLEERYEFTCPSDEGEDKTVFVIRPLSARERFRLMELIGPMSGDVDVGRIAKVSAEIVEMGVVEIRGLVVKGKKMDFSGDEIKKAIDLLPVNALVEVAGEVVRVNFLGEDERKN